ncbi:MAG: hypothetical protein K2O44_01720 [Clostridia bacterium]|nr:hypothetical protein [Clostridia bacterium]
MKKIKLSIICTAAILLALPFAGCMHADSGNADMQRATTLTQEVKEEQPAENECPDGDCDDNDDKCPDGKCPEDDGECPDGKCPRKKLPHRRRGKHRKAVTLPCPICGDNN